MSKATLYVISMLTLLCMTTIFIGALNQLSPSNPLSLRDGRPTSTQMAHSRGSQSTTTNYHASIGR